MKVREHNVWAWSLQIRHVTSHYHRPYTWNNRTVHTMVYPSTISVTPQRISCLLYDNTGSHPETAISNAQSHTIIRRAILILYPIQIRTHMVSIQTVLLKFCMHVLAPLCVLYRTYIPHSYVPAFPKLWSADHRWSSGSALVVLLGWTLVQKRQKK
jgi:hypothetical protein